MRTLIAFGTKYGSTEKVAEVIADVLRSSGQNVDVVDLRQKSTKAVDDYDMVVVGSSIIVGGWSKGSKRFLEENCEILRNKKTALFVCCSNSFLRPDEKETQMNDFLKKVVETHGLNPISLGLFGGEMDFERYGFMVKAVLKKVGVNKELEDAGIDTSQRFDFRDWDDIKGWAAGLTH